MVSKNDGVMNAFIAIAACAILVYIVYAYNKSRTDGLTTVFSWLCQLSSHRLRTMARITSTLSITHASSLRHLPTVSQGPSAADLLPHDAVNSQWAQSSPAGMGGCRRRQLLDSRPFEWDWTHRLQSSNSVHGPSSTPLNPQVTVSVWNQHSFSRFERRPLEIVHAKTE
jgi:hypothetical protein